MHTKPTDILFDPATAAASLRKHGVSFEEAATALLDERALAREDGDIQAEQRWVLIGMSAAARLLTVVYTLRSGDPRLISARTATAKEERNYAS